MMDKKKQIEEMAKLTKQHCTIDNMCGSCSLETCNDCLSEVLYNADYRKASEVAREIFEEIEKMKLQKDFTSRSQDFEFGYKLALADISELKKKYTEGGE